MHTTIVSASVVLPASNLMNPLSRHLLAAMHSFMQTCFLPWKLDCPIVVYKEGVRLGNEGIESFATFQGPMWRANVLGPGPGSLPGLAWSLAAYAVFGVSSMLQDSQLSVLHPWRLRW